MKKKLTWLTFGNVLLASASVLQGFQYYNAFRYVHYDLGLVTAVEGFLGGITIVGALAFGSSRIPRIASKRARRWATSIFIIMLFVSPFILTPVNWYTMGADLKLKIGYYSWFLAGLVALAPELALVLVAFSIDGGLIKKPRQTRVVNQTKPSKPTNGLPKLKGNKLMVYKVSRKNPLSTNVEIARNLEISPQMVGRYKKQLIESGHIKK